ncbi:uncharacterized protein K02A2.6-like, partial [Trichosurus vulpecula]|uniref:uncharacterized protein K02A2.6-like n=1 Tax=Trichosurus vulpecula TaxID=9337 RepID=UPI00186B0C32
SKLQGKALKVTPREEESDKQLGKWVHITAGHLVALASYRWALDRGINIPLDLFKQIVQDCIQCQLFAHRPVPKRITGELARGALPAQIWQIDYIGPLPVSQGCQYACTCVDTYSGVLVACPYKRATQKNTCKTLDIISLYYGTPLQIQSDNGTHFKGKDIDEYCRYNNIEWIYHIPYYPQAAGLIERMNGLLKEKLKKLSENNDLKRWKENLFEALKQLNNRPLTSEGGTPLSRMMTTNLQIRRISSPLTIQWWALHENARQPWHASLGSAGYDLYVTHDVHIPPLGQQLCSTGVGVKLPEGYYGQLSSRFGLALKNQVHVLGGVIDSDYGGEIKVCLHNSHESEPFECKTGERICQLVILPYLNCLWQKVNGSPDSTERGDQGFGSSNDDISWIPEKTIPGTKVSVKKHQFDKPRPAELIAQGNTNTAIVVYPGDDKWYHVPLTQMFLRN